MSNRASEIYGKDLVADLCSGFEIEFRLSDYNDPHSTGDNDQLIETTIEELEKMAIKYAETINLNNVNISGVVRNHIKYAVIVGYNACK